MILVSSQAKHMLAQDASLNQDTTLISVLEKVHQALAEAVPQVWINYAADVSDMAAIRMHFVEDSASVFQDRPELLDAFVALRSLYNLNLLRDLSRLKRIRLDASVNFLVSSIYVDLQQLLRCLMVGHAKAGLHYIYKYSNIT